MILRGVHSLGQGFLELGRMGKGAKGLGQEIMIVLRMVKSLEDIQKVSWEVY